MSETLIRQWMMLRHVPRHPRKVDAKALAIMLSGAGFEVSRRSIERDLMKLATVFPLRCDDRHKPYGWSWEPGSEALDLPSMDVHAALAFRMAAEHLRPVLPEVTLGYLEPHFLRAKAVLDGLSDNRLAGWPEKVRVLASGQPVRPPAIDVDVLEHVQAGLLGGRRLAVVYRKRGESEARRYEVHPLALVWRDAVGYLLCMLNQHEDVMQLVLHRMESVVVEDAPSRTRPGFSVDDEIARGAFDFLLAGEPLAVEALFDARAAVRLRETPVADDQVLVDEPDGRVRLRATLADTVQLRAWLRSFGELVVVLGPPALRAALAESARAVAALYDGESDEGAHS